MMLSWCCWSEFVNMEVWSCSTGRELCWFWYFSRQNRAQLLVRVTVLWGHVCVSLLMEPYNCSPDVLLTFFFPDVEGKHIGGGRAWRGGFEELITECSSSSSCIGRGLNSVPTCRWIWPFASTSCGSCCKGSPSHHSGTQSDKKLLTIAKTSFLSHAFMKCCVFVTELGLVIFLLWFCCGLQNLHLHLLHQVKITTYLRVC